ncbi:hypothetical protein FQR65_LT06443 [Abscondita terminalis]|nr:hypothetical protein FQR65_LT06443 [Abscondita terminalis]
MGFFPVFAILAIFFIRFQTINGDPIDYRLAVKAIDPGIICSSNVDGYACNGCRNVVYCTSDETGKWTIETEYTCPTGQVCLNGDCGISNKCPVPSYAEFKCNTDGIFPDPGDCQSYHICSLPSGDDQGCIKQKKCEGSGYGYDPLTTLCKVKLTSAGCVTNNVPTCTRMFEKGPIPLNPSLYYECRNYTLPGGTLINSIYGLVDYRLTSKHQLYDYPEKLLEEECSTTGLSCRGCCEVVLCQKDNAIVLGECPLDQVCMNGACYTHKCTTSPNLPFICSTIGSFPDPVDCRLYHYCVPSEANDRVLEDYTIVCENSSAYGYNSTTTLCSKTLINGECGDYPIPLCTKLYQKGPVPGNPSLYYSCLQHPTETFLLYPYQKACPNVIYITHYGTINGDALDHRFVHKEIDLNEVCSNSNDGFICDGCYTVKYCMKDENNQWVTEFIGNCPTREVCKDGDCMISNSCPFPDYVEFQCLTTGIFPDPSDCMKYHICIVDTAAGIDYHKELTCVGKYQYNPLTTVCSTKLPTDGCTEPNVPPCARLFETGRIPGNPSLYYECRNYTNGADITEFLYPYQKRCDNGKRYNPAIHDCE